MCGRFLDAVIGDGEGDAEPSLRHSGQPVLNRAAAAVRKKESANGSFTWLEPEGVDCSPLEAVTIAYGILTDGTSETRSGVVWAG